MKFSRLRVPRVRPLVVVGAAVVLLALGGGWLWLRDSSLVAVQRVTVLGATGPDSGQIQRALMVAGRGMTTLDVNSSALHTAVSPYPVVKGLRVSTHFPHGMTIRVVEQIPVAVIAADGRRIAVADDGTLLRDVHAASSLPQLPVHEIPGGTQVTDQRSLQILAVLGAAPWQLLGRVTAANATGSHGIVVELRQGPQLYFGDPTLLSKKWTAADDVLADPGSNGASYIDVTDPYRPAAGATGATSSGSAATGTASAATSSGTAGGRNRHGGGRNRHGFGYGCARSDEQPEHRQQRGRGAIANSQVEL